MLENEYIVIQVHGTFKHNMMFVHANLSLFIRLYLEK